MWTPRLESRVTDLANVLSAADRERIARSLARYEQETSHQIGVLVISTLNGEDVETFSLRVAKASGLGRKGFDNGILVTVVVKDRRMRIELGSGMEKYISNAMAQSIIHEAMIPAFRKNDFAGGIEACLNRLMQEARRFVARTDRVER